MIKYNLDIIQENLNAKYGLDLIHDILLNKPTAIVFYYDKTDPNLTLNIISGDLETIGFKNNSPLYLYSIFDSFDTSNEFGNIIGQELYKSKIINSILNFEKELQVSFPINKDSSTIWIQLNLTIIKYSEDKSPLVISGVINNISLEKEAEADYLGAIQKDSLTGLFNRKTLIEHLIEANPLKSSLAFAMIDIDNFKLINDRYGHVFGDLALQKFALLLRSIANPNTIYYRYAGDEFFVQILNYTREDISLLFEKVIEKSKQIVIHESVDFRLSLSIGIYITPNYIEEPNQIINKCDFAMYSGKKNGKNQFVFFDSIEKNYTPPQYLNYAKLI